MADKYAVRPQVGTQPHQGGFLERGWTLAGLSSDTQLSAYLARPDQRSYDLADLTVRYLKRELRNEEDRRAAHGRAASACRTSPSPTARSAATVSGVRARMAAISA